MESILSSRCCGRIKYNKIYNSVWYNHDKLLLGLHCFQSAGTFIIPFDLLNNSYPSELRRLKFAHFLTVTLISAQLASQQLICCHPLFIDEHHVVENITDTGYPGGWATLHPGRERCCLPSGTDPEGERFAALTGAFHVVINYGHGTALVLLTFIWSVMPLLRLDFGWKKKNLSPEDQAHFIKCILGQDKTYSSLYFVWNPLPRTDWRVLTKYIKCQHIFSNERFHIFITKPQSTSAETLTTKEPTIPFLP